MSAQTVLVLGADGKPVARAVLTGLSDGRNTQIIAGLDPGDEVIRQVVSKNQPTARPNTGGGFGAPGGGPPGGGGGGGAPVAPGR